MDIHPFKSIIKEKCGLCFEAEKTATLADGIRARMAQRGMTTDSEYLVCLMRDEDEFHSLINLLTINETYFFREPIHLDLLADKLVEPMLADRRTGSPVQILCAGCSTGEEPYSVMIKLLEKYDIGIKGLISVIGADIDSDALSRAQQGVYSGLSFRGFPETLRNKYFEATGNDSYRIKDFVKEQVRFMKLNLMSEGYPDVLCGTDAIFYRNVSIYFEPETQRSIFNKLAGLLKEKGWLFVSSTETLSHNHGALSLIELDGVFCYQKNNALTISHSKKRVPTESPSGQPIPSRQLRHLVSASVGRPQPAQTVARPPVTEQIFTPPRIERSSFNDAIALAMNKNYKESLKCIDGFLERDPSHIKGYMLKAGVLINMKRLEEAEQVCRRSIEIDQWNLEGHLLLGLIAKLRNDNETAIKRFKEALYIQSSCWLGHFYLAEIFSFQGQVKNAIREYEIVINLLKKGELADHGLTFSPLAFPAEQINHLCQHNLTKLKQGKA